MDARRAKLITRLTTVLFVAASISSVATAQHAKEQTKKDAWGPLRFLVGSWTGESRGNFGPARVQTNGELILGGKYLFLRTKSVSKPQEKSNPQGETHEDWAIISYDQARSKFVLRQFNAEGFVNRYEIGRAHV